MGWCGIGGEGLLKLDGPILLVDDDREFLAAFRRQFERMGLDYLLASTAHRGLELLRRHAIALIISDIIMEPMNGYEFCREVRRHPEWDHIPILLLSVSDGPETRTEGLEAGADGFLPKPFRLSELRANVAALLRFKERMLGLAARGSANIPNAAAASATLPERVSSPIDSGGGASAAEGSRRADEFFSKGMREYAAQNYESAIAWFQAALRAQPWHAEARHYHPLAIRRFMEFARTLFPSLDYAVVGAYDGPEDLFYYDLDRDESYVLSLVDGRRSVKEIAGASNRGVYKTYRILGKLFRDGVIGLLDDDGNRIFRRRARGR